MKLVVYDGSFEGLLTTIFEIYEYKMNAFKIKRRELDSGSLLGCFHIVNTDREKAKRVLSKLEQKISRSALGQLYRSFLSELPGIDNTLFRYVRYIISARHGAENDYGQPDVLAVQQVSKKVHREKHRMEAFVRFQLTKDGLYYALIQPDYNVLPLIAPRFRERYADQRWLIYDYRRKYGLYYDLQELSEVTIDFSEEIIEGQVLYDEKESIYQELWKTHNNSMNISERKNRKLYIQHVPKIYWRHLIEKQSR
jgi:probable DNA metabolism protein